LFTWVTPEGVVEVGDDGKLQTPVRPAKPGLPSVRSLPYTRALYLANGDILLSGPEVFDPKNPGQARKDCFLAVLDQRGGKLPVALGVRCNEGPAVSRHRLHLAWTEWTDPAPGEGGLALSKMAEGDLVYVNGVPKLEKQRLIIHGRDLPFRRTMETQNFRPPDEKELTFSAYFVNGRR